MRTFVCCFAMMVVFHYWGEVNLIFGLATATAAAGAFSQDLKELTRD